MKKPITVRTNDFSTIERLVKEGVVQDLDIFFSFRFWTWMFRATLKEETPLFI